MSWKALAIVFIILFVVETSINVYTIHLGTEIIRKEKECINLCLEKEYDSFIFDEMTDECSCYLDGVDTAGYYRIID